MNQQNQNPHQPAQKPGQQQGGGQKPGQQEQDQNTPRQPGHDRPGQK